MCLDDAMHRVLLKLHLHPAVGVPEVRRVQVDETILQAQHAHARDRAVRELDLDGLGLRLSVRHPEQPVEEDEERLAGFHRHLRRQRLRLLPGPADGLLDPKLRQVSGRVLARLLLLRALLARSLGGGALFPLVPFDDGGLDQLLQHGPRNVRVQARIVCHLLRLGGRLRGI